MRFVRWLAVLAMALVVAWLAYGIKEAREAARNMNCRGHMSQLTFALQSYHDVYGQFPPAFTLGPDGTRWHSWRVLVLPFSDQDNVYKEYRFDEPWNSPHNRQLERRINLTLFQCPSHEGYERNLHTNYVVVVGAGTAFPGETTTMLADFHNGGQNTILLVEMAHSGIHWMEPRDLELDTMSLQINDRGAPSISSPHPRGPAVVFADSIRAYRLRPPFSADTLRRLFMTDEVQGADRQRLERSDPHAGVYLSEERLD
jgi:hypothetical protein